MAKEEQRASNRKRNEKEIKDGKLSVKNQKERTREKVSFLSVESGEQTDSQL